MPFRVTEQGEAEHKTILLEDLSTGTKTEIYAFGAMLNAFSIMHEHTNKNLVEAFHSTEDAIKNMTPAFQGAKLSPFVCRLKEGQYTFTNVKHKIEKYYSYREAIHGLIYDAVFTVAEIEATAEEALVTLSFDYHKNDPGFPFFYNIHVTYRLQTGNELSVTTKVTNLSAEPIPMADGWHPYFTLGKKVDNLELFIGSEELVVFDNKLLPTGKTLPFHTFSHLKKIETAQLDNCFILRENQPGAACTLNDPESGLKLSIFPDKNYPYLQIFIPQHRNSIAIENLSSLPDAFNNGIGLIILKPAESITFATRFVITTN